MKKIERLWKFISFSDNWLNADTSVLDDIAPSWFARREKLILNSRDYAEFLTRLKRKHAIETGIVERMYDIDKGVTETLIKEGFLSALISHGDTNIEKNTLLKHLQDHLNAVDFVFDVVKENRPLTKGFVFELHQLTTRHQEFAEGRDQFGNKTKIGLIKGRFKERENNPTREDGTVIMYCPPEHVDAEMDKLIKIYNDLEVKKIHPLIIAAWVHHAFTTIHPFQDGNGRVVRLIVSLIMIKHNYFLLTVLREEAKIKYIDALEKADAGESQKLITYFAEIERRNIEEALNIREVSSTSLDEVTRIFKEKILKKQLNDREVEEKEKALNEGVKQILLICNKFLNEFKEKIQEIFSDTVVFDVYNVLNEQEIELEFYPLINILIGHSQSNPNLPKTYCAFEINLNSDKRYTLLITLSKYGYDNSAIEINYLLINPGFNWFIQELIQSINIEPHIISIEDNIKPKEKNIHLYLENVLTAVLAQIASEI